MWKIARETWAIAARGFAFSLRPRLSVLHKWQGIYLVNFEPHQFSATQTISECLCSTSLKETALLRLLFMVCKIYLECFIFQTHENEHAVSFVVSLTKYFECDTNMYTYLICPEAIVWDVVIEKSCI